MDGDEHDKRESNRGKIVSETCYYAGNVIVVRDDVVGHRLSTPSSGICSFPLVRRNLQATCKRLVGGTFAKGWLG